MRSHSNAGRPVCVKTILTEALKFGAWDVLPKPLNTAEVVRSVRYGFERLRNQDRVGPVAKALAAAG